MKIIDIAKVAHNANKSFCEFNGDYSQVDWDIATDAIKASIVHGVEQMVKNGLTAEQSHETWRQYKADQGYVYGDVKNDTEKTHPCMVPYSELSNEQKYKDILFRTIVLSLKDLL